MADAQARGWEHPDDPGFYKRNIIPIIAGGVKLYIHKAVAHLFKGFLDELVATGYRLDLNADDWGYNNRDIRGRPGTKSNHAWGLAIDINAISNPMTEAHPSHAGRAGHDSRGVHTDMPPETAGLAKKWGLTWGANYNGTRKDAMHFEFLGTPSDVKKYPIGGTQATPEKPAERKEEDDLRYIYAVEGNDQALFLTVNWETTHTLNYDSYIHLCNIGIERWPHKVPVALHEWMAANTKGQNIP